MLCSAYSEDRHDICQGTGFELAMFITEFIGAFIFVNTILTLNYHHSAQDHIVNAAGIGLALMTALFCAGGTSGGGINPAIGLVQQIY